MLEDNHDQKKSKKDAGSKPQVNSRRQHKFSGRRGSEPRGDRVLYRIQYMVVVVF